jgi:hypothetical protein
MSERPGAKDNSALTERPGGSNQDWQILAV